MMIVQLINGTTYRINLISQKTQGVWVTIPKTGARWFIPYTSILYMRIEQGKEKKGDDG